MPKMPFLKVTALSLLMGSPFVAPVIAQTSNAPLPPEIENEQILSIDKQPWHATLMPYGNLAEALIAKRSNSSFARSLNGDWKFNYVPRPEQRPVDFYKTDFDDSKWKTLTVPSNWQLHGYGTPYYRNIGYTFQRDWPHVMSEPPKNYTAYDERNPVGSYRRDFDLPVNWAGRRIFLNFAGVDSAFYLWVNGQKVGYNVNSRNAVDFDITPYLKVGQVNKLAVEVYRYSVGSYLEDMDMWRLSGIFRNVTLWSAPQVHVRDFRVVTDLDEQYRNATLKVEAKVRNYAAADVPARNFAVTLYDAQGKSVGAPVRVAVPALAAGDETTVNVQMPVTNPAKWTAETPNLYTAVLSLQSGATTTELLSNKVGFREIEVKGRLFCVNGVPIKLKGANRHESNVNTGHYVTEANMIQDLELLKQANCNHVRTSHYSNDPRWYELCDQYGIYLVAEANVECHGDGSLSSEPRMEKMFVDRNVANVENFKNSPSIIIWSMGNESQAGPNMRAAEKMVRSLDPTRVTHYEAFGASEKNPAGIDSQMYTNPTAVENIARENDRYTKPFYLCEYAHAMFNSMGALGEYNDVFDKYPSLLGGAIWEWEDQGIWNRRDPKRQFIAYGGGFGEFPNDHYFIHKGVVFSDRSPKPHYPEVKRVYQWIGFAPVDLNKGQIKVKNKYAFISLKGFKGTWSLLEDGVRVQNGVLPTLDLAPTKETTLTLPIKTFVRKAGALYTLDLSMALGEDKLWAKAGYVLAQGQLEFPIAPNPVIATASMKPLQLVNNGNAVTVTGDGFDVAFNSVTGQLDRLARGGVNVLLPNGGPALHLWRAQHRKDDEYAAGGWDKMGLKDLKTQVLRFEAKQISPSQVSVSETIQYSGKNGFGVTHAVNYSIFGDGSIKVDNAVMPQGPEIVLARVGVRMLLDKRLGNVDYLARGPMENYADRKRGSDIGRYSSTVAQQMTPYAKPMENGNHEDARWIALRGQGMPTLLTQSEGAPLQFSTLPYRDEEMETPEYSVDLPASNATVLNLASKTLGVGSASCGPRPLPQYLVNTNSAAFSYGLRLLPSTVADVSEIARTVASPNRVWPVLAETGKQGLITLDAGGNDLDYSTDGATWQTYNAPFKFERGGELKVRSKAASGQSFEGVIPFDPTADRGDWKVTASDFQNGEGNPEHVLDGDSGTFWHSRYSPDKPALPHFLVVDIAKPLAIKAVRLTPRPDGANGRARDYELYLSNDDKNFGNPVLKGNLPDEGTVQILTLPQTQTARYIKFVIKSEYSRQDLGSLAEISVVPALN